VLLALILPPVMRLALKLWGFKRVHAWLWRREPLSVDRSSLSNKTERATLTNLACLMNGAANCSPIHTNCLQRSLTQWWLFRRMGFASDLRIGVDKQDDTFKAHAWLELEGNVLNDSRESVKHFTVFNESVQPVPFDRP
jgi:hypothetical protein